MKKTLFVVAIVAVLVFAFAASAMAASYLPNRSSAFLGAFNTSGNDTVLQEIAISAGGTKAAYISWAQASATVGAIEGFAGGINPIAADTVALQNLGPHSGYSMTTVKCQVCHSAHKAPKGAVALTADKSGGCVTCHGAASTFAIETVAAGSVLDNRHGGATACSSYLCHSTSPHGAHVSDYPAAASALLSDYADAQLAAAVQSGVLSEAAGYPSNPASAVAVVAGGPSASGDLVWAEYKIESPNDVYGLGEGMYKSIAVEIMQPAFGLNGATAALQDPNSALGRAVATGYTCANEGCHINGSFNGMSSDAYYGQWKFYDELGVYINPGNWTATGLDATATIAAGTLEADGIDLARRAAISGHALFQTMAVSTEHDPATAWNESALCIDCHDQQDARLSEPSFPHSNTVWAVNDASVGSTYSETIGGVAYTALYNDAAWFTLSGAFGDTAVDTTTRQISGIEGKTYEPLTVAMDGACLKCHQTNGAEGVGKTF